MGEGYYLSQTLLSLQVLGSPPRLVEICKLDSSYIFHVGRSLLNICFPITFSPLFSPVHEIVHIYEVNQRNHSKEKRVEWVRTQKKSFLIALKSPLDQVDLHLSVVAPDSHWITVVR